MEINIIVASSINGVIGKNNQIPWHYPEDLKYFKKITKNNYVIMGRKTFESIGKPLKNRINLVISKTLEREGEELIFSNIYDSLIWLANQEIAFPHRKIKAFAIGGEMIYDYFLKWNKTSKIFHTIINKEIEGDRFFKIPNEKNWKIISKIHHDSNLTFTIKQREK